MADPMPLAGQGGHTAFSFFCNGDPYAMLRRAQGEVLGLCNILEEIADSLPDRLNRRRCRLAASIVEPLLASVHEFEETTIFPMARRELWRLGASNNCINRLEAEHFEDQGYAGELAGALNNALESGAHNPEMLGYMLRGFFESVRRHTAFERDYVSLLIAPR
ncbi:MAG: hemerythrin domain-containing protein [Rhizobiaceae bacterium]